MSSRRRSAEDMEDGGEVAVAAVAVIKGGQAASPSSGAPPRKAPRKGRATIDAFFVAKPNKSVSTSAAAASSSSSSSSSLASAPPALSPEEEKQATAEFDAAMAEAESTGSLSLLPRLVPPSWLPFVRPELVKPYFKELVRFLEGEQTRGVQIFPPAHHVFNCFRLCNLQDLKVVIIGQDPYHGEGQAMGMSFSVAPGVRVPPSLVNIYKEVGTDVGDFPRPSCGDLSGWARQGVLLMNASLTVEAHKAGSHSKKGWQKFTAAIIDHINRETSGLAFILWGRHAQTMGKNIDKRKHLVINGVHPSGLSAHKGFFGSKPFSQANEYLESVGKDPIDWRAPH